MQQLFDTSWEKLNVGSVERFLSEVGEEGLTWEAKGGVAPHPDSIRKAVCGFANAIGGYLIIGAERDGSGWTLPGVEFPSQEPGTWTSSVISSGGVSPLPAFDAKPFPRGPGRDVVVIRVEPTTTPPCITRSGTVYLRVSGQTVPVTDQRVLVELIQRGVSGRARAEACALRAAKALVSEPHEVAAVFALALCPTGGPEDKAAVLFNQQRAERFYDLSVREAEPRATGGWRWGSSIYQDSLRVTLESTDNPGETPLQATAAVAYWDGTVAVVLHHADNAYTVANLSEDVKRFWRMLGEATRVFDGTGDAHLALVINLDHVAMHRSGDNPTPKTDIRRWTEAREPTVDELANVEREIARAFGRAHWEPPTPS